MTWVPLYSIENAYGFLKNALYRACARKFSNDRNMLSLIEEGIERDRSEGIVTFSGLLKRAESFDKKKTLAIYDVLNSFIVKAVLNMASEPDDERFFNSLNKITNKYLNLEIGLLGTIQLDPVIKRSIKMLKPIYGDRQSKDTSLSINTIVEHLIQNLPKKPVYQKNTKYIFPLGYAA